MSSKIIISELPKRNQRRIRLKYTETRNGKAETVKADFYVPNLFSGVMPPDYGGREGLQPVRTERGRIRIPVLTEVKGGTYEKPASLCGYFECNIGLGSNEEEAQKRAHLEGAYVLAMRYARQIKGIDDQIEIEDKTGLAAKLAKARAA